MKLQIFMIKKFQRQDNYTCLAVILIKKMKTIICKCFRKNVNALKKYE